jgi:predicted metal-dependent hydrolase
VNSQDELVQISTIQVEVRKRNVKSLRIGVFPPSGLVRVIAPLDYDQNLIESVVIKKMVWIRAQQEKFQLQERLTPRKAVSGESYFYKGKKYKLFVLEGSRRGSLTIKNSSRMELSISSDAKEASRLNVINNFYRRALKEELDILVPELSKKMGLKIERYSIRKMKNRWGSCDIDKKQISVNIELIKKNPSCLTYIVVHELVHLLEAKHNQRFKELMDLYLPNWRYFRDILNSAPLSYSHWDY